PTVRGRGILLLASGAARGGQDSLAHRLQLRYQRPAAPVDPPLAESPPVEGPAIIAPGGSWQWDATGLRTGGEVEGADGANAEQWWQFAPGADPHPLGAVHPGAD